MDFKKIFVFLFVICFCIGLVLPLPICFGGFQKQSQTSYGKEIIMVSEVPISYAVNAIKFNALERLNFAQHQLNVEKSILKHLNRKYKTAKLNYMKALQSKLSIELAQRLNQLEHFKKSLLLAQAEKYASKIPRTQLKRDSLPAPKQQQK